MKGEAVAAEGHPHGGASVPCGVLKRDCATFDPSRVSCRPPAEEASGSGEGAGAKGGVVVAKDGTAKEPEKPAAQSNEERQVAANAAQKEALLSGLARLTVRGSVQQSKPAPA